MDIFKYEADDEIRVKLDSFKNDTKIKAEYIIIPEEYSKDSCIDLKDSSQPMQITSNNFDAFIAKIKELQQELPNRKKLRIIIKNEI